MNVVSFALLLFMLINAPSMFEFHMLVVVVVILNILELIMEIVPNYTTDFTYVLTTEFFSCICLESISLEISVSGNLIPSLLDKNLLSLTQVCT
jgi:hypothetical protein